MRERIPHSLSGHILNVELLGDPGMLHRAKYSRFRNESLTSFEEDAQSGPLHLKGSPSSHASTPNMPVDSVAIGTAESPVALCALIPRMGNLKLANPSTLPSLKNFCLRTKEVPRIKLTECVTVPSSPTSPEISLTTCLSSSYPRGDLDKPLKGSPSVQEENVLLCTKESALLTKPVRDLGRKGGESGLETGVSYSIRYMGCIEVLQSMRSLDFGTRTQVTREAISRLCEAVPGTHGAIKKRKPPAKFLSPVLGKSNLQFSGISIKLTISTSSLTLMNVETQQILANHHMQSISFASGGDPDTTDYVAYVAKDPVNQREITITPDTITLSQRAQDKISPLFVRLSETASKKHEHVAKHKVLKSLTSSFEHFSPATTWKLSCAMMPTSFPVPASACATASWKPCSCISGSGSGRGTCHILECPSGVAQEVINTIGQAFELRFKQYLKNPSTLIAFNESEVVNPGGSTWNIQDKEDHEYYNEISGKEPPAGGLLDIRLAVPTDQKANCPTHCEQQYCPTTVSSKSTNIYENYTEEFKAIGIGGEQLQTANKDAPALLKSSSKVDLFDDPRYINTQNLPAAPCANRNLTPVQTCGSPLHCSKSLEAVEQNLSCNTAGLGGVMGIKQQLWNEECYHGKLTRRAAETLLVNDGDFLVRESATSPGQYVLSGLQRGQPKHLLLVDPEGKVRTKDHTFDSIGHLIRYHMENKLPIISSGSELNLNQPVRKGTGYSEHDK